ncbi:MAG: bifunctional glycosyltransferase family 2/GtrA family protein [Arcanobacterium sp.]|nr:bifunctional glycosyltransferase family 2/GtrA family protein [Arcanobacterium sp.]
MIILIPAYEPQNTLPNLVSELKRQPQIKEVVVVDDGSGTEFNAVFNEATIVGAEVIRPARPNRGKGYTLREGFAFISREYPGEIIVTADCDGQHLVADIVAVGTHLKQEIAQSVAKQSLEAEHHLENTNKRLIVLGGRRFSGKVPLRSKFGNFVTRKLFQVVAGQKIFDTQTGLRAFSPEAVKWSLTITGDRFEYEFLQLLEARDSGVTLQEIPIETVYLNENSGSHFRPIADSVRIYRPLINYIGASLSGFVVDFFGLLALVAIFPGIPLFAAVVIARIASMCVNFLAGYLVFGRRNLNMKTSFHRYLILAGILLVGNYLVLSAFTLIGLPLVVAKILTEVLLWITSFSFAHRWIYRSVANFPQNNTVKTSASTKQQELVFHS